MQNHGLPCHNPVSQEPLTLLLLVRLLSRARLFATPWTAARQASLCITDSQSFLRLTSIKSVMPSSHLILCRPLLLLPSILPSIRVTSNKLARRIRWPKGWTFSISCLVTVKVIDNVRQYEYMLFFFLKIFDTGHFFFKVFKLFILYWAIADSQCCVNLR